MCALTVYFNQLSLNGYFIDFAVLKLTSSLRVTDTLSQRVASIFLNQTKKISIGNVDHDTNSSIFRIQE